MDTHQQWADLLHAVSQPRSRSDTRALLRQAVDLSRDVAPDTVGCSVTAIEGDRYYTPVYSDSLALDLDRAQYESGDGPCMAAAREQRHQSFDAMTHGDRFPGFTEAAVEHGVRSSISLPLTDAERPAAINLYASSRFVFDAERPRAVAGLLARCVSALVAPDRADGVTETSVPAAKIEAAHVRARLITEAETALMTERSVSRAEALSLLIRRSRAEIRSIFDVASEVVGTGEAGAAL